MLDAICDEPHNDTRAIDFVLALSAWLTVQCVTRDAMAPVRLQDRGTFKSDITSHSTCK